MLAPPRAQTAGMKIIFIGKIISSGRKRFVDAIEQASSQGIRHIIADLTHVSFVDGAGLALLAIANDKLKDNHISFSILCPAANIMDLLALAAINRLIPCHSESSKIPNFSNAEAMSCLL